MSDASRRHFRYDLEPLLTLQQWNVDSLVAELRSAASARLAAQHTVLALQRVLAGIDGELRRLRSEGVVLDLGRERWLRAHRNAQVDALTEASRIADAAAGHHAQIQSQLSSATLRLRAQERHRLQQQRVHEGEQRRRDQCEADASWLQRLSGRRACP